MKKFLRNSLICIVILLGIVIVVFIVTSDKMLVGMLSAITGNKVDQEKLERFINADTLRYFSFFMIATWGLLLFIIIRFAWIYEDAKLFVKSFKQFVSSVIRKDLKGRLPIILIVPVATTLFYAFKMPVGYDESWTWLNFTSRSVLASVTYYPAPNNHILHSVLTNVFSFLPFSNLFNLRLPIILIQIINLFLFYRLVKEFFNEDTAIVAVAFFGTCFMTVYYSYMSRGYALQAFSFLLLSFSILKLEMQPKNKILWFWYVFAGIIGFYSVPSFLYPWVLSNVFLFWKFRKITREHLFYGLVTFIVVVYLYVPIIILNGYHALLSVQDAVLTRMEVLSLLPGFLGNVLYEIIGFHYIVGLFILLGGSLILLTRYKNFAARYFVGMVVGTPILLFLHGVIPFSRTIYFWVFIVAVAFAVIYLELFKNIKQKPAFIIILLILQVGMAINYLPQVKIRENHSLSAHESLKTMQQGRKFYVCSNLFDSYLLFNLKDKKISGYSINYQKPRNIDVDTITNRKLYDFIIVDKKLDVTRSLLPISQSSLYNVYGNN